MRNIPYFIGATLLLFCFLGAGAELDRQQIAEREVKDYIHLKFGQWKAQQFRLALRLAPLVASKAIEYDIDPILVAEFVYSESGFRVTAEGKLGERGLMQVHGLAAKGFDLNTPAGQLDAGLSWLSHCIEKTSSPAGDERFLWAINCYMAKDQSRVCDAARWRYKRYLRALKKIRGKR